MTQRLIVADENIPEVGAYFSALGEVRTVAGRALGPAELGSAEILLVRSVTRVDRALLEGSRVRFVGTATIGTDHLDLDYLRERGIAWASAPGSNATSVVEYVLSCLCALDGVLARLLDGGAVGIVGLGNVGGSLRRRLLQLGIRVIAHDPLLPPADHLRSLDEVLAADVVCCHTPLTRGGAHPTWHLLDAPRLRRLRPGAVLLNAGRGAVVDNRALLALLDERPDLRVVLDVWEGEPAIATALLDRVAIGTPHIAGYSLDGKRAGTRMILDACRAFLGEAAASSLRRAEPTPAPVIALPERVSGVGLLRAAMLAAYDVREDDRRLRAALAGGGPQAFDLLRKHYPVRRELAAFCVDGWDRLAPPERALLSAMGFGRAGP